MEGSENDRIKGNGGTSASEHSSSAAGSGNEIENEEPTTPDENNPEGIDAMKSDRFRVFDDQDSPRKPTTPHKTPPFVCFIGNFPSNCSMSDLRDFIISKQVAFTEIRMGPKKKHKSNGHVSMGFGYVDLATRADYEKLLKDDGCMYKSRKIRIDHATQKKNNTNRLQVRKNNINSRKNKNMNKHQLSRKMIPRLSRWNSAPGKNQMGGRAARFFRTRKTGARNYQKKAQRRHGGRFDPFGGARPREDVLKSRRGIGSM